MVIGVNSSRKKPQPRLNAPTTRLFATSLLAYPGEESWPQIIPC